MPSPTGPGRKRTTKEKSFFPEKLFPLDFPGEVRYNPTMIERRQGQRALDATNDTPQIHYKE